MLFWIRIDNCKGDPKIIVIGFQRIVIIYFTRECILYLLLYLQIADLR